MFEGALPFKSLTGYLFNLVYYYSSLPTLDGSQILRCNHCYWVDVKKSKSLLWKFSAFTEMNSSPFQI